MHNMHHMHNMGPMGMGINPLDMLFAAMHQPPHVTRNQPQPQHIFEAMFGLGGMGPKIIIHNFTQQNMNEPSHNEPSYSEPSYSESSYDTHEVIALSLSDAFNGVTHRPVPIQYEDETHLMRSETIMLNVPPAIPNGHKVGIPGRGNMVPNSGGRRGTLHLEISIEEHPQFRREGDADLVVEQRVSLKDALCGFTFDLVHLNGRSYKFNCKPCSITGSMNETKVLPGLGYRDGGALKIRFSVVLPTSLTGEQIAALSAIL